MQRCSSGLTSRATAVRTAVLIPDKRCLLVAALLLPAACSANSPPATRARQSIHPPVQTSASGAQATAATPTEDAAPPGTRASVRDAAPDGNDSPSVPTGVSSPDTASITAPGACALNDLHLVAVKDSQPSAQERARTFTLRNSGRACIVGYIPPFVTYDASGRRAGVPFKDYDARIHATPLVELPSGRDARFALNWNVICQGQRDIPDDLAFADIGLPRHRLRLPLGDNGHAVLVCDGKVYAGRLAIP